MKTQNLLFIKRDEFPSFGDSRTGCYQRLIKPNESLPFSREAFSCKKEAGLAKCRKMQNAKLWEAQLGEEMKAIGRPENVLKVDSFLNHQMDIFLIEEIGREFHRRLRKKPLQRY